MSTFDVTTAITAYETYSVEADSPEEAIRLAQDEETRSNLPSRSAGHGDDETVIDVKGAGVSTALNARLTFQPQPEEGRDSRPEEGEGPVNDELLEARYEGFWSRLLCPHCEDMFEIEDDVSNGQVVCCDACGEESVVSR